METKTTNTATLVKLGDTDLTVNDPREDIRGRTVVDRNGEEIGHVDALLIDDQENKVRFLQVASGGILGIGEEKFLVPVDAVARVGLAQVVIDQTGKHISGAPKYDPDLTYDTDYYSGLYSYYGYGPYWGPGYAYPAYPTYPY